MRQSGFNECVSEVAKFEMDGKLLWKTISRAEGDYWKLPQQERLMAKESFIANFIISKSSSWIVRKG